MGKNLKHNVSHPQKTAVSKCYFRARLLRSGDIERNPGPETVYKIQHTISKVLLRKQKTESFSLELSK